MLHQETARFLSRFFAAVFDVAPFKGVCSFAGFRIVFAVDSLKKKDEIKRFLRSRVLGVHAVFPVKEMNHSVVPCDIAESRTAMDDAVLVESSQCCAGLFEDEFLLCFGLVRVEPVLYGRTAVLCHHVIRREDFDLRNEVRIISPGNRHAGDFIIKFLFDGVLHELVSSVPQLSFDPVLLPVQCKIQDAVRGSFRDHPVRHSSQTFH